MDYSDLIRPLGDYCLKVASGATPKGGKEVYFDDGDISLIRSQHVYNDGFQAEGIVYIDEKAANKLRNVEVLENDILLNITGDSVARVCIVPDEILPARVNQHVLIIRVNPDELDYRYVHAYLSSKEVQAKLLMLASSGATRNALTKGMIESFGIPKLEIEIQQQIGRVSHTMNRKRWNNQHINSTLESIAQTLFKSWFVDFDPVRAKVAAKANGEDPQLAAMMAISGKTAEELQILSPEKYQKLTASANLFPDELIETSHGEIPKGWEWKAFGEFLEKTIGGDWGTELPDVKHIEKVCIIRGTDLPTLQSGGLDKIPIRYVQPNKFESRELVVGDLIVEVSGGSKDQPTGRSIMINQNLLNRLGGKAVPASFCRLMRPAKLNASFYLAQHMKYIYDNGKTWLYQNQSTGISNFQTKHFLETELLPFEETIINNFAEYIKPLVDQATSNESLKLAELRDTLLPKLLSGEFEL